MKSMRYNFYTYSCITALGLSAFSYGNIDLQDYCAQEFSCYSYFSKKAFCERRNEAALQARETGCVRPGDIIARAGRDIFLLNKYLFNWDTAIVAAVIVPIVAVAYHFDHKIHETFYDAKHHKNVNQMPKWTRELARFINAPVIGYLGLRGLLGNDPELRATSEVLLLGIPFVTFLNEVIRLMRFDICYRPWNEHFSCVERTPGGFPSGHLSKATYLAVLYGTRYGPAYAIPLSCLAGFIGATFLSGNRHYLSQLIAGVGVGAAYGLAASKLVDYKLANDFCFQFCLDDYCRPTIQLCWDF